MIDEEFKEIIENRGRVNVIASDDDLLILREKEKVSGSQNVFFDPIFLPRNWLEKLN